MKIHRTELRDIALVSGGILGALWVILALSSILPLRAFGILPRTAGGLIGIFFAPFLHADATHLAANSGALLMLGWILFALEGRAMFGIMAVIIFFGGLGTWLIGRGDAIHIGASGLIYGIFGYILAAGIFKRSPASILGAIVVLLVYGGLIWGVLPQDQRISWEGHLCGFLAGAGDAKFRWEKKRAKA
jgi:membrane associated rhomboid family serine protease